MGNCCERTFHCCYRGNLAPCKKDVWNLRCQLKDVMDAEMKQIREAERLTSVIKGFSGLIDPGHSWKAGSVSNAMTSYMDDLERVCEDRKRRLEISLREVERRCNRIRDACDDVEYGQMDMKTFDELRVEVVKDLMLYLSHRDIHLHADALTRLTKTYQKVMDVRTSEMQEMMALAQGSNLHDLQAQMHGGMSGTSLGINTSMHALGNTTSTGYMPASTGASSPLPPIPLHS